MQHLQIPNDVATFSGAGFQKVSFGNGEIAGSKGGAPAYIRPKVNVSAGSRGRKPYRAKCQTETRVIFSAYFVCDFKSLELNTARKPRKSRDNARRIKSFKINDLVDGGDEGIRTLETVPRLHP